MEAEYRGLRTEWGPDSVLSPQSSTLIDKGHGAVVLERDDHHFAKAAGRHFDAGRRELAREQLEKLARPPRLLGVVEAGAPSLRDRAGERELRHREDRAAGVADVAVHLAGVIAEDAQLADLARGGAHRLLAVALLDRGEDEEADADRGDELVADADGGAADALDHALHRRHAN